MKETSPQSTASKYAAKQRARALRMFDARTSAMAASGFKRLTPEQLEARRLARAQAHEQRTIAEYEKRRAQIRAEVNRAPSSRQSAQNKCRQCGFSISPDSTHCGECLCEEDGL